ncbi:sulfatase-like hydrolase/transferase [Algibacter lectus]|nr:sulfatase-like hydrolase/transferase [Algibacter lectus]
MNIILIPEAYLKNNNMYKLVIKSIFLILVINASSCKSQEKQEALKKPNIIWLMAEDMSVDLACYGMQAVKTPYLDKMASEGIRFDNAFVTNPICSPSRSAMMIGTHQVKTNTHNHRSNRDIPLNKQFTPFTQKLREVGYTAILGNHAVMNKGRKIDVNFKHDAIGEWDGETKFGLFDKYDNFEKTDEPFFAQIQLVATHRGGIGGMKFANNLNIQLTQMRSCYQSTIQMILQFD